MKKTTAFIYAFIAAFGALVVGMNLGGISGAIDIIVDELSLNALAKGFVTGVLMVGCLFGALLGGRLSDKFGRKPMLIASALLLGISAIGCSMLSHSAAPLVIYRLIGFIEHIFMEAEERRSLIHIPVKLFPDCRQPL